MVTHDVVLLLEGCAAIRVPDPERTRELRRRYLAVQLDGWPGPSRRCPGHPPRRRVRLALATSGVSQVTQLELSGIGSTLVVSFLVDTPIRGSP